MKSWLDLEKRFRELAPKLQDTRIDYQWGRQESIGVWPGRGQLRRHKSLTFCLALEDKVTKGS